MAHLICKNHKRRSQVSEYEGINNISIVRVLHRSDKSRCDGDEVVINKTTIVSDMLMVGLRRNLTPQLPEWDGEAMSKTPQLMNSV